MQNTKSNAEEIWKQFEDLLVPLLGLSVVDRAAYSHLLRHSRIEGRVRLRFSILWLALGIGLSSSTARDAVRRLVNYGALRLVARTKGGHVVEVRLPGEIPGIRARGKGTDEFGRLNDDKVLPNIDLNNIEEIDFMQSRALRKAIHARERGQCFYCLRRLTCAMQGLDHVVPRAQSGSNSYRNLVSCCLECNSQKGETPAGDFLRWLFREGRLTTVELTGRLRALQDLASGKLLPPRVEAGGIYPDRRSRSCRDPVGSPPSSPLCHVAPGFSPASSLESHAVDSCSGRSELVLSEAEGDRCFSPRERPLPQSCSDPVLPQPPLLPPSAQSASASTTALAELERMTILRVFEQAHGDKALAGKMLGISRATLYRKLKRYNIPLKSGEAESTPPS